MTDIASLFADQPVLDESTLPDAAPEPEQAPEPETPFSLEQESPEPQLEQQHTKHVPLSALQEERQRRQEYQQELDRERQRAAQMEQRFQQMVERMQAAQPPVPREEPIPAFEEDPAAHVAAVTRKYEQEMAELRQFKEQQVQLSHQQAQQYQLMQAVQSHEAAFMQATPDYADTTNAYTQRRLAEYTALGLDDVSAKQQIARDFQGMAMFALQRGQNPAEALYKAARAAGIAPAAQNPSQAPAPAQQAPRAPNGQFPKAPVATSLSNVSGAPQQPDEGGALTLEKIASMSDKEFDAVWRQMERGQIVMPKV